MTETSRTLSPLDTIQAVYGAFARADIPSLLDLVDDDVDWARDIEFPGGEVVPHLRHGIGKAVATAYFEAVGSGMEIHKFAPRTFAVSGDDVLVVLDVEVTVRATGKRIAFDEVHEFTVRDGRIVRYRPHLDTAQQIAAWTA